MVSLHIIDLCAFRYRDMASQKYNILYGRLSQEDERQRDDRQKESNSIHNQKLFLEQYAADHGFENTLFLADDGYSGTNFDEVR